MCVICVYVCVCMFRVYVWYVYHYFCVHMYVFHMVWWMPGVWIQCVHDEVRGNSKCLLLIPPLFASYTEINSRNLLLIIRRRYNFKGIYFKYFKWNAETHVICTEGENYSVCFASLTVTSGPDSSLEKTSQELCSICLGFWKRLSQTRLGTTWAPGILSSWAVASQLSLFMNPKVF